MFVSSVRRFLCILSYFVSISHFMYIMVIILHVYFNAFHLIHSCSTRHTSPGPIIIHPASATKSTQPIPSPMDYAPLLNYEILRLCC